MYPLFVIIISIYVRYIVSFNVEADNLLVISSPQEFSYFGYALATAQEGKKTRLYVGAPIANSSISHFSSFKNPGVVYDCNILDQQATQCQEVDLTPSDTRSECLHIDSRDCPRYDGAWLGGSLATLSRKNKTSLLACGWKMYAHIPENTRGRKEQYLMTGGCLQTFDKSKTILVSPLMSKAITEATTNKIRFLENRYSSCEGGFSAHFTQEYQTKLLLGAPGMFMNRFKGNVTVQIFDESTSRYYSAPLVSLPTVQPDDTYYGYSITSGNYFNKNGIYFATGSPRDFKLMGQVNIYPTFPRRDNLIKIRLGRQLGEGFGAVLASGDVTGDGLAELFIAAPTFSTITTISSQSVTKGDNGRVVVYSGTNKGNLVQLIEVIGVIDGGRFGSAISVVGDINQDGLADVVIGAPYEQHDDQSTGSIYLYHGHKDTGIVQNPVQRIMARSTNGIVLRGFGASLSPNSNIDIDNNGYPDTAVGAYQSGHVAMVLTRPIVSLESSLETPGVVRLHTDNSSFELLYCFNYLGHRVPPNINISVNIRLDANNPPIKSRAFLPMNGSNNSTYQQKASITHGEKYCKSENVSFHVNQTEAINRQVDVRIQMSYQLDDCNQTVFSMAAREKGEFPYLCPVIEPKSLDTTYIDIPLATDCDEDGDPNCDADLFFTSQFIGIDASKNFVIGSRPVLPLSVTLANRGEDAFLPWIDVEITSPVMLDSVPNSCRRTNTNQKDIQTIRCSRSTLLKKSENQTFLILLNVRRIPSNLNQVSLKLLAGSTLPEKQEYLHDNEQTLFLYLETDYKLVLKGLLSLPADISMTDGIPRFPTVNITQNYEIRNQGETTIPSAHLEFRIPTDFRRDFLVNSEQLLNIISVVVLDKSGAIKCRPEDSQLQRLQVFPSPSKQISLRQSDKTNISGIASVSCSLDEISCTTYQCNTNSLSNTDVATVMMSLTVNVTVLGYSLGGSDEVLFTSTGRIVSDTSPTFYDSNEQGSSNNYEKVSTTIRIRRTESAKAPRWILFASIGAGILLLLFVTLGLIQAGFFRRKKKEELENLRNQEEINADFEVLEEGEDALDDNELYDK